MGHTLSQKKHIVVVGGGFAGVRAAIDLDRRVSSEYRIILVDRNSYHTPYSMLYEAASAYISGDRKADFRAVRAAIAIPFHLIIRGTNISFVKGDFEEIDFVDKRIKIDGYRIPYEYAVLALGSTTNYYSVPGLEDQSFPFKSLDDAQNLRNAIEELFIRKAPHQEINIVVGGGGFSGVEVSSELSSLLKSLSRKYKRAYETVSLTLIEAGDVVLPGAHPKLSARAENRLESRDVQVVVGGAVTSFEFGRVLLSSGLSLSCDALVWTAGIGLSKTVLAIPDVVHEKGFMLADEFLRIPAHNDVFLVGDLVRTLNKKGKVVTATAQRAIAQGAVAAENIYRTTQSLPLLPYEPRLPAFVVPLGGKFAAADLWGFRISGFIPWVLKLLIEYKYLLSVLSVGEATKKWLYGVSIYIKND